MIRIQRSPDSMDGFTLIESLAAMALMGIIMAAIATLTMQWLPNWNRGVSHLQQMEQAATALERIAADLAAAEFVSIDRDSRHPYFQGEERAVTFIRSPIGPNAEPGLEVIRIAEVAGTRGPLLVRSRADFPWRVTASREPISFVAPVILLHAPMRISFSYAGPDRIWKSSWRNQPLAPKAVQLQLKSSDPVKSIGISTAVAVRADLPADCTTAKSVADCYATHLKIPVAMTAGRLRP